jgi:hypothetical protein
MQSMLTGTLSNQQNNFLRKIQTAPSWVTAEELLHVRVVWRAKPVKTCTDPPTQIGAR